MAEPPAAAAANHSRSPKNQTSVLSLHTGCSPAPPPFYRKGMFLSVHTSACSNLCVLLKRGADLPQAQSPMLMSALAVS
ncbi:hypothetical protein FQA47_017148 [Oryzias melastigma]|uniref:Uncharacterized protein n=1 Tax=Oryzias melastigma TaxID=30732 RepID=A0A834F7D7_ORYME|nr:hypothetical protein FQA47_017148 [Oryzias melastigma]